AYDTAGNMGSGQISVTVNNADTIPPTVTITYPYAGSSVSGTTAVATRVSDNNGIAGIANVEFYIDGVLSGNDTTYIFSWSWNTTTVPNGSHTIEAKVYDTSGNIGTGQISVTVSNVSPLSSYTLTRTVIDGYDGKTGTTLEEAEKTYVVQTSDDDWWKVQPGYYTSIKFSDSVPDGANITSVVIYVEHWEDKGFAAEDMEWKVGTGWPDSPIEWGNTTTIPVLEGSKNEDTYSWDVTSFVDTPEKANSLELYIKNNSAKKKVNIDYIYAQVKWMGVPAAPSALAAAEEPGGMLLKQNFPNPFNPDTWIPYQLVENADVIIRIYSVRGKLVRTLDLGYKPVGFYTTKDKAAHWNGRNEAGEQVSSGVYFYTIQAGDFVATRKMIVAR
ncbi:Ig-like domain-containing protein, partial [Candidatus Poribacteria bacterium]